MKAHDYLLASAYTEYGRHAEASEAANFVAAHAYSLLQLGHYSEGLLVLEHGKTQLLLTGR